MSEREVTSLPNFEIGDKVLIPGTIVPRAVGAEPHYWAVEFPEWHRGKSCAAVPLADVISVNRLVAESCGSGCPIHDVTQQSERPAGCVRPHGLDTVCGPTCRTEQPWREHPGNHDTLQAKDDASEYTYDEAWRRVARAAIFDYVLRHPLNTEGSSAREHAHAIADSLTCHLPERAREWHRLVNEDLQRRRREETEKRG